MYRILTLCLVLASLSVSGQSLIWITDCANKNFCLNNGSCTQGSVYMVEKAGTSCGSQIITYSYKVDLDNNGSIDIQSSEDTVTGNFAKGTHKITWKATDNCGNVTTCTYLFTIKDCNPPSLLCINGLTQNLEYPSCEATFYPAPFVLTMTDNCTPNNQIQMGIRKSGDGTGFPSATSVTFGECDAGTNFVEIWVKDANGLTNSCQNYVLIQPNQSGCTCNPDADLYFKTCARKPNNQKIPGFVLKSTLASTGGVASPINKIRQVTSTDSCSQVYYDKIPFGGTYKTVVQTERIEHNHLDGVSTFDLVLISKHILGIQQFQNFYQSFAADVNKSSSVTTFDIVEIRKLILGLYDSLPGITAWRMIRPVSNPANLTGFATVKDTYQITLPNLQVDTTINSLDFIAIKYGDINTSAAGYGPSLEDRDAGEPLPVYWPDEWGTAGTTLNVPVLLGENARLEGWQMALRLDPAYARITGVEGLPADQYSIGADGTIRLLWMDAEGKNFERGEAFFTLKINCLKDFRLYDILQQSAAIAAEGYNLNRKHPVVFQQSSDAPEIRLTGARPNPFQETTAITLEAPLGGQVRVEVIAADGGITWSMLQTVQAGQQLIALPAAAFPNAGVYWYRVSAGGRPQYGSLIRL